MTFRGRVGRADRERWMAQRGAAMDVAVRLLGPPAVRVDGAWVPLRPTKPHAAFAYLAYRGAPVRRAEVAALMWPDADAEHAFADLRQALRSLRCEPFGELLERDRGTVWLDVGSDVAAFRSSVAERRWADALACPRGPLLGGRDRRRGRVQRVVGVGAVCAGSGLAVLLPGRCP